jgi:hypothetical protein
MDKIKKMFAGMVNSVKEAFERFPLTTLLIFIISVVVSIFVIGTKTGEITKQFLTICSFTAVGTFLVESIFEGKKDIRKAVGIVISVIIAIIIDKIYFSELFDEELIIRWAYTYAVVLFFSSVYILLKKSEVSLNKYALNLILNVKRSTIIYGVVAIGFSALYAIFSVLIYELDFDFLLRLICLFTGFYYIPVIIKAFSNIEAEDTKFNKAVFLKVLLPLVIVAMIIVYMYMVKIFFITEVPKNELFAICSAIFVCAFPIYLINKNYAEEGSNIRKLINAIPYIFAPFILLQIYSMGIRVAEYGFTEERYAAFALIVFEICTIILSIVKQSKYLDKIILILIALNIIIFISPFNHVAVTMKSQKAIVDKYIAKGVQFDDLADEDKRKFAGAYQYIEDEDIAKTIELEQTEKEKLSSYSTYVSKYTNSSYKDETENTTQTISESFYFTNVDISKYNKIYVAHFYDYEDSILTINCVKNEDNYTVEKLEINIENWLKKIIKANESSSETLKRVIDENKVIEVNSKFDFYVSDIYIKYNTDTNEVDNLRLSGYILEK